MNYSERAETIRFNAKSILDTKKIETTLKDVGELFYTGSYALDLMTWNDIDMQIVPREGIDPVDALGALFTTLSRDPDFIEAQMISFKGDYKPKMPRGVYLGTQLNCLNFGGLWKIDLWVLSKNDFEKNRTLITRLASLLNPENRKLILELKHEMMRGSGRVPNMGSHVLYEAILLEGLSESEAIYQYMRNRGIQC